MDYHDQTVGHARPAVVKYCATTNEKKGVLFVNPDACRLPDPDECC